MWVYVAESIQQVECGIFLTSIYETHDRHRFLFHAPGALGDPQRVWSINWLDLTYTGQVLEWLRRYPHSNNGPPRSLKSYEVLDRVELSHRGTPRHFWYSDTNSPKATMARSQMRQKAAPVWLKTMSFYWFCVSLRLTYAEGIVAIISKQIVSHGVVSCLFVAPFKLPNSSKAHSHLNYFAFVIQFVFRNNLLRDAGSLPVQDTDKKVDKHRNLFVLQEHPVSALSIKYSQSNI